MPAIFGVGIGDYAPNSIGGGALWAAEKCVKYCGSFGNKTVMTASSQGNERSLILPNSLSTTQQNGVQMRTIKDKSANDSH